MRKSSSIAGILAALAFLLCGSCVAQTLDHEFALSEPGDAVVPGATSTPVLPGQPAVPAKGGGDTSNRFGVGVSVSTLGVGGEVAYKLSHQFNVRGGFNLMSLSHTFTQDQITYGGKLRFRSAEAYLDWFFLGPLHLSPGALLYNGNNVTATVSVASGQTFTLNDVQYESSSASPLSGSANLTLNKVAPSILFGVGNMIPRNGRHFSGHFEIGGIYEGSPNITLNFAGSACQPPNTSGPTCQPIATTPAIQSNIAAEQSKVNHDAAPFKFYPIISTGFSIAF